MQVSVNSDLKKQGFLVLVIFKDITKVTSYASFLYLRKHFVISSFKTNFIAHWIVKSRFQIGWSVYLL